MLKTEEDLVFSCIPLVRKLASRYRNLGQPLEDLIQAGNLGLVKAAQRFEDNRGCNFSSFAGIAIIGEIKNYFRDYGLPVRMPIQLQIDKRLVDKTFDYLVQTLGRDPTNLEAIQETNLSAEAVEQALGLYRIGDPLSLDLEYETFGGDISTLMDTLGSKDNEIDSVPNILDLQDSLCLLDSQEKEVIYLLYQKGLTQAEASGCIGKSQMEVSRRYRRALSKLKETMSSDTLDCGVVIEMGV